MLCDTCRWTGRPGFVHAPRSVQEDPCSMIPCPDCGGQGIAHCCDGICEQPDLELMNKPIPQRALMSLVARVSFDTCEVLTSGFRSN
jgi:hypothetical protein